MAKWSRALNIRLSDWCCSVSMVWVQIMSREEQKFVSPNIVQTKDWRKTVKATLSQHATHLRQTIFHQIKGSLCNQCPSPLTLWVRTPLRRGVLDTTLNDKVCHWLATGRWFFPDTPVSSTNKTDRHDITEILLKVALNITTLTLTRVNPRC